MSTATKTSPEKTNPARSRTKIAVLSDIDRALINCLQEGFPICDRPYQAVAETLGIDEALLIERIQQLLDEKVLTRFGPMYHAVQMGGAFSLAAMQIPEESFDEMAEIVNQFPEIAHNYEREHTLNMWFVIATETPEGVHEVIEKIEAATGYHVYNMPKEEEFYVNLRFKA